MTTNWSYYNLSLGEFEFKQWRIGCCDGYDRHKEVQGKREEVESSMGICLLEGPATLLSQRSIPVLLLLHGGLLSTTWKSLPNLCPRDLELWSTWSPELHSLCRAWLLIWQRYKVRKLGVFLLSLPNLVWPPFSMNSPLAFFAQCQGPVMSMSFQVPCAYIFPHCLIAHKAVKVDTATSGGWRGRADKGDREICCSPCEKSRS